MDYPYVENEQTGDVLETEDDARKSKQARYPFVQYYGQAVDFVHGNELDPTFYNVSVLSSTQICLLIFPLLSSSILLLFSYFCSHVSFCLFGIPRFHVRALDICFVHAFLSVCLIFVLSLRLCIRPLCLSHCLSVFLFFSVTVLLPVLVHACFFLRSCRR